MTRIVSGILAATVLVVFGVAGRSPAVPTFGAPVRVPGGTGFEPGIDIGDDGTVWVNEPSGNSALPHGSLFRSRDGGQSFERITFDDPWRRLPGGFDSDFEPGPGGHAYFLDLWLGSSSLTRSDDGGETWTWGTPFTTALVSDRQWITVGPQDPVSGLDTLYALYHWIQPPFYILVARSRDSGTSWLEHRVGGELGTVALTGPLVADDTGFVAFNYGSGGKHFVAASDDAGETWRTQQVSVSGRRAFDGMISNMAMDPSDGSLHVVWVTGGSFRVTYARSTDLGQTWSAPVDLTPSGSNVFPWVAARNGKVAIAWYGSDRTAGISPDDVPPTTTWRTRYAESTDGGMTFSSPVDASPQIVKRGPVCTQGLLCMSDRNLGDFMQVAIGLDGRSLLSYGSILGCPCGTVVVRQET